jgi:hypothetical protein
MSCLIMVRIDRAYVVASFQIDVVVDMPGS